MWIKVFRDRQSDFCYTVQYHVADSHYTIENEQHLVVEVQEEALFHALEKLYVMNQKEE